MKKITLAFALVSCLLSAPLARAQAVMTNVTVQVLTITGLLTNTAVINLPASQVQALVHLYATNYVVGPNAISFTNTVNATIAAAVADRLNDLASTQIPYPLLTNKLTGQLYPLRSLQDQLAFQAFLMKYKL